MPLAFMMSHHPLAGDLRLTGMIARGIDHYLQDVQLQAQQADGCLETYFKPTGMAAPVAKEREATWMRRVMHATIGKDRHLCCLSNVLQSVDENLNKRDGEFDTLRARPSRMDFIIHRRRFIFVNLGTGACFDILQDWGHDCVPCATEGCASSTAVVLSHELALHQVRVPAVSAAHTECDYPFHKTHDLKEHN